MDGFRGYVVRKYFYVFNNMCKIFLVNYVYKIVFVNVYEIFYGSYMIFIY